MELSDIDCQVIVERLGRPKFFESVFATNFASSSRLNVVMVHKPSPEDAHSKYLFAVLIKPASGEGGDSFSRSRGRRRSYDLRYQIERLVRDKDANITHSDMQIVIVNHIRKEGFHTKVHRLVAEAAYATNPQVVRACMSGGKFLRTKSILSEKEKARQRIRVLKSETAELKKLVSIDPWYLRGIISEAGKYAIQTVMVELKAKFGNKLRDVELNFDSPPSGSTTAESMMNCLEFFKETFNQLDQTDLFTYLARSQKEDFRKWCALAAPKSFLLPLLIDADPTVRNSAKINREDRLYPLLEQLHKLELELKQIQDPDGN